MKQVYQKAPAGAAAESEAVDSDEDGDLDADEVRRNLMRPADRRREDRVWLSQGFG